MLCAETCCGLAGILLLEPFEYYSVCFFRLFLLNPMAAIQIDDLYIGHEICQVLGLGHWITVAIKALSQSFWVISEMEMQHWFSLGRRKGNGRNDG